MKKYIWEGPVGVSLEPKQASSGDYFWTFQFHRCFRKREDDDMHYASSFTQRNSQALGTVMSKAFQFMGTTAASEFAAQLPDRNESLAS